MNAPVDPVALARDLLRCPSVTPAEGGALALLENVLQAAGFDVHRLTFSEPGTAPVENLYARIGTGAPHLDVRRPHRRGAARRRGRLVAAAVRRRDRRRHALRPRRGRHEGRASPARSRRRSTHLAEGPPTGSISFLITGDEEGIAVNGTVKLLQWAAERGEKFDHCILGEPTNTDALGDMIKVGRRGSQNGTLVVTGKQGHVAYPERADNPVRGLVALMGALMYEPLDHGTAHFGPSNLEFTSIDIGNPTVNLIPGVGARALQRALQRQLHPGIAARADRAARAEHRAQPHPLAHRVGAVERRRVPRAARPVHRSRGRARSRR